MIDNYIRNGMTPVLVTDLRERRVTDLARRYVDRVLIVTLTAPDSVIRQRIQARSDGFTDCDTAAEWNERVRSKPNLPSEIRIDSSERTVDEIVAEVLTAWSAY